MKRPAMVYVSAHRHQYYQYLTYFPLKVTVVMDAYSGELAWKLPSNGEFVHIGTIKGICGRVHKVS